MEREAPRKARRVVVGGTREYCSAGARRERWGTVNAENERQTRRIGKGKNSVKRGRKWGRFFSPSQAPPFFWKKPPVFWKVFWEVFPVECGAKRRVSVVGQKADGGEEKAFFAKRDWRRASRWRLAVKAEPRLRRMQRECGEGAKVTVMVGCMSFDVRMPFRSPG